MDESNVTIHAPETASAPTMPQPRSGAIAMEPLAIGAKHLANLLGVSLATVHRWDAGGLLGPAGNKIGGRRLWPVAEVRAWVAAGMPDRATWLALKRVYRRGQ
jgi:hypothetical protein